MPQFKSINSLTFSFLNGPTFISIHDYWKNHSFDFMNLYGTVMFLLFNMLSMFVIAFLPRSKCLLISWLQSPTRVILETKKINSLKVFIVFPFICHELIGPSNLENSAVATGLEKVSFHSNSKERQCQRMLKLPHNCTHLTR